VRALADRLRADGVEAWIDQYIQDPNEGWIRWMRQKVKQADKVLLTFTETYQRRFEGDEEGKGLGATFEGVIVTQALYESGGRNAKFRPVSAASWGQALCSSHNSTNSASRRRRSFSALASIFVLTKAFGPLLAGSGILRTSKSRHRRPGANFISVAGGAAATSPYSTFDNSSGFLKIGK
jgi:hypothetical protein